MAAPPKPWEKGVVTSRSYNESINNQMSSLPGTVIPDNGSHPIAAASPRQPPPIPVRPSEQRTGGLSSYGGGLSSYGGYGGMSGYGGYGGYGGLGGGYGGLGGGYGGLGGGYGGYGGSGYGSRFDMQQNSYTPNSFVRTAEESSRQAFQSIESVVQAFGSVSMMLESTFYAVYNSFRAVIGVADQFTRMKMHFAQIFSAFAVIRTLKWIYRKLMVLIRLRKGGLEEDVWNEMSQASGSLTEADIKSSSRSSWPVLMFFAIVIGGPWLIWKLLSSLAGSKDENSWASGMSDHFVAVGEYDFDGDSEDELSFTAGQNIIVAPKELQPRLRGWLLASVDGKKVGIVPANYVKVLGKRRGRQSGNQTARGPRTTSSQPDLLRQTYSQTSLASNQPNSLEEAYSQPDPRLTQPYNQTSLSVNQPSYPDATFNQNDFSFNQSEQSTAGYNQDDPFSNNADPLDVPTIQQNPQGFNPKSSPPNTASSSSTFQAESQSSLQSSPQDLQTTSGLPQSSIPNRDTTKKVHFISVQKPEESLDNKNVTERDDA